MCKQTAEIEATKCWGIREVSKACLGLKLYDASHVYVGLYLQDPVQMVCGYQQKNTSQKYWIAEGRNWFKYALAASATT